MTFSIRKLNLSHFRNYETLRLDFPALQSGANMVVLTGDNGAGKTNILEAISLLTPGRGLRSADLLEMKSRTALPEDVWTVSAELSSQEGDILRLGTGLDRKAKRRVVRINGSDAKAQADLSEWVSAVWLTPQMDRLFIEGASGRRKFFDRLVYAHAPEHAGRLNRYDRNLRERMKLLEGGSLADPHWLAALEAQLSADAVSIAVARDDLLQALRAYVLQFRATESLFPAPALALEGWTEGMIGKMPALDIEDALKIKFRESRNDDRAAGKSHIGIHRSDFIVHYAEKDMPAAQCSTGEQKGLLISIVLAHAQMTRAEKGSAPFLLLDEIAAHLDEERRLQLFRHLQSFGSQVWLTGTEAPIFAPLEGKASFWRVGNGRAVPLKNPVPA